MLAKWLIYLYAPFSISFWALTLRTHHRFDVIACATYRLPFVSNLIPALETTWTVIDAAIIIVVLKSISFYLPSSISSCSNVHYSLSRLALRNIRESSSLWTPFRIWLYPFQPIIRIVSFCRQSIRSIEQQLASVCLFMPLSCFSLESLLLLPYWKRNTH